MSAQGLTNAVMRHRERQRLTQAELASRLGRATYTVRAWCSGGTPIGSLADFAAACDALGLVVRVEPRQRLQTRPAVVAGSGKASAAASRPKRSLAVRTPQRAADERTYLNRIREWLEDKECARCGTTVNLTVQHLRGRRGRLLLNERWWLALCWPCHAYAEHHPTEAKAKGWAESKLGGVA